MALRQRPIFTLASHRDKRIGRLLRHTESFSLLAVGFLAQGSTRTYLSEREKEARPDYFLIYNRKKHRKQTRVITVMYKNHIRNLKKLRTIQRSSNNPDRISNGQDFRRIDTDLKF